MATFNLILTYPDGQGPRIVAALKARAATEDNPNPTNQEAIEWFRAATINALKDVVLKHERDAAVAAAAAGVSEADVS